MLQIDYPRYFRLGQPIQLERVFLDAALQDRNDRLSGQIARCDGDTFVVHFPYDNSQERQDYPFFPGMPFVLHGDYHGLGVAVPVFFEQRLAAGLVLLSASGALQFYYRHSQPRLPTEIWHGVQRLGGTLLPNLRLWRRQVERVHLSAPQLALPPFVRRVVTLDAEGIELEVDEPSELGNLSLVYLALDDRNPLIVALAEVVRVDVAATGESRQAGLHFINILDGDRRRIDRLVRDLRRAERGWTGG